MAPKTGGSKSSPKPKKVTESKKPVRKPAPRKGGTTGPQGTRPWRCEAGDAPPGFDQIPH